MKNLRTNGLRIFQMLFLGLAVAWGISSSGICLAAGTSASDVTDLTQISFKILAGFPITKAILNAKPGRVRPLLPKSLLNLDGKRVSLLGFMLPLKVHNRMVTQFMLMRNQNTCCFGIPPELNEVVEVSNLQHPVKILMDTPIKAVGRLHVQERREGPFLYSIYQMDLEDVTEDSVAVD